MTLDLDDIIGMTGTTKKARTANKRLAKKRFLWIIETLCNAFSFVVVEKIDLRNPLIRQAPFVMANGNDLYSYKLASGGRLLRIGAFDKFLEISVDCLKCGRQV